MAQCRRALVHTKHMTPEDRKTLNGDMMRIIEGDGRRRLVDVTGSTYIDYSCEEWGREFGIEEHRPRSRTELREDTRRR